MKNRSKKRKATRELLKLHSLLKDHDSGIVRTISGPPGSVAHFFNQVVGARSVRASINSIEAALTKVGIEF